MSTTAELAQVSTEELRTFHITGQGLPQLIPGGPLRPPGLDLVPAGALETNAGLLDLYAAAVGASRGKARAAFLQKLRLVRERLAEVLALDNQLSPHAWSPAAVSASLDDETSLFRPGRFAEALQTGSGRRKPMDSERRTRIEATLATLDNALREAPREPPFWVFHTGQDCIPSTAPGEFRQVEDSFTSAMEFCDEQLIRFARVLRALRTARLECESGFVPSLHDTLLQQLDWQAAEPEELLALPPVLVVETAKRLGRTTLTCFGRLLRSGRPIHVLVCCVGLFAEDLSGSIADFGYLAMAHREAFVLQSSCACPDHLTAGLLEMTGSLRPAVGVVSVPREDTSEAWTEASLLYLSRAFPLFRYDPDRGETWSERFTLFGGTMADLLPAHAAAASVEFLHHFRVLPVSVPDREVMQLREYLEKYAPAPPPAIPFILVQDGDGQLQRAI